MTEREPEAAADAAAAAGPDHEIVVHNDVELDEFDDPVDALTREEVRRRAQAPLPRSLLDFLR